MGNWVSIVFWIAIIGAVLYNVFVKKSKNRKAAESGEDRESVRRAAAQQLDGTVPTVYAHWEERESYGRRVRITYHRYALSFQGETLWVFPLGIDKKTRQVQAGRPVVLTPENLGKVTVKTKEKNGATERLELWLGDKQGHVITELTVDAENLRKNRWYPVNILQREECAALERFMTALSQRVAAENPGVDELIKAESNESVGILGAVLSGIGAVVGIFMPPAGLVLCLIGLIMSVVSKKRGAKQKVPLVISVLCTALCAGLCWLFLKYFI
ncbi:hypothetical protein [uncultured Oscillibacter sp.]|uniref:hypothetical protein n=1 Tax=uncultured Oscillibacter sp. TaxID=876091 RepID=UPI0025EEE833|nr:hypothetical protein [uncultured Oscillibacter sp.]